MIDDPYRTRTGLRSDFLEIDIPEIWNCFLLPEGAPEAPAIRPNGVYHTDADVIVALPKDAQKIFQYAGEREWYQIGARILENSGWRPDCSVSHRHNLRRAVPPIISNLNPLIFGSPDATEGVSLSISESVYEILAQGTLTGCLRIEIMAFLEEEIGFLRTHIRDPIDAVSAR